MPRTGEERRDAGDEVGRITAGVKGARGGRGSTAGLTIRGKDPGFLN